MNGVPHNVIKMSLFPFSLIHKARSWYQCLPQGSIEIWKQLVKAFLTKFFPLSLTSKLRAEIIHFGQREAETLYDAWDRFRELLRRCPQHGFELSSQIKIFCNGLTYGSRTTIDATFGGSITKKTGYEV